MIDNDCSILIAVFCRVLNINRSIKICADELSRGVDMALNKSSEDFRKILGLPMIFNDTKTNFNDTKTNFNDTKTNFNDSRTSFNETNSDNRYDYITGRKQEKENDTYHTMISKLPMDQSRVQYPGSGSRPGLSHDIDTTTEFQSPIRGVQLKQYSSGETPSTVPRYSTQSGNYQNNQNNNQNSYKDNYENDKNDYQKGKDYQNNYQNNFKDDYQNDKNDNNFSGKQEYRQQDRQDRRQEKEYRQGHGQGHSRLNISDIPIVDSASDRSSPQVASPSEEEKEGARDQESKQGKKNLTFF